jgi:hypothetical protein
MTNTETTQRIDGMVLGDACLHFYKKSRKTPGHTHSSKHKEYLEWLSSVVPYFVGRPIWFIDVYDKRTTKTYPRHWMRSLVNEDVTNAHARWYPEGKKRLPEELTITPLLLLHWFLDDGSVVDGLSGRRKTRGLYLASDDFTLEECERLASWIERDTGIPVKPHKNDANHRLYVPARYADGFLELIGPCPVNCFAYKWCR